jgi:hypothetical protein
MINELTHHQRTDGCIAKYPLHAREEWTTLRITFVERDYFYSEFDHLAQEFREKPTNQANRRYANS